MKTKKVARRALLTSVLALVLCVSMLVGTTFAWFTDSVTSSNNIIKSGTLDVTMQWKDATTTGAQQTYVDASTGAIFDYDLWEPGYVDAKNIQISNVGTLALKYQLNILANGEVSELADVIDVYFAEGEMTLADRTMTELTRVGTLTEVLAGMPSNVSGDLEANASDIVTIALKMQESAGNEYQNLSIGSDFAVQLLATQLTAEKDSFDDQYDADSGYPIVPEPVEVDNTISFTDFETLIENGGNIYLTESVTVANPENSRFTEFELNGNVGIYAAEDAQLIFAETTILTGNGTLTVYEGAIDEKQELCVADNATLVFEAGEHSFAALSVSGNGKIVVNGGTLNCLGTYAGILGITFGENGKLIVNDGTLNMYQPFNLNPNRCDAAYIEINDGTIDLLNGIENLFVVRNVMDKDKEDGGVLRGSSIRVNGGTFIAHYEIDSAGDATSFVRNSDSPADTNKVLVSNAADNYDCIVTGGTFYGSWQRADNQRYTNGNGGYSDGLFVENSIAGFVADGYEITGDATNGYVVSAK